MTATYTFDLFSSLDGFGGQRGNWGGYSGAAGARAAQAPPRPIQRRAADGPRAHHPPGFAHEAVLGPERPGPWLGCSG